MARKELYDIEVQIHASTAKAILVSLDGERDNAVWLALSQIEVERKPPPKDRFATVTLPTWIAEDKGLV
jgi:NH3-dependent NAD+ synthetase